MTASDASKPVLERLANELENLTPQARKAARYVLENPRVVAVSTVRQIAKSAGVKPNTLVRMARQLDYDGFEDFRTPFRDALRDGGTSMPERVRWLQDVEKSGELGGLYAEMAQAAMQNLQDTFADINVDDLRAAAQAIWNSRNVFTLGVGVNRFNAGNFTYLASTGMIDFHAIPNIGATPADDLAWADERDIMIAITCKPYRKEVVETVALAKSQNIRVIGISDSPASPIVIQADHGFVISCDTPQFFPSSVSTIALLETLLSFVIAVSDEKIITRVETFYDRRHRLGMYETDAE